MSILHSSMLLDLFIISTITFIFSIILRLYTIIIPRLKKMVTHGSEKGNLYVGV